MAVGGIGFEGAVIEWRGPAPFVYAEIPPEVGDDIRLAALGLTYWGQVPVDVEIDGTGFFTALFPRDDGYLLPLTKAVRTRLGGVDVGDRVAGVVRVVPRERSEYWVPVRRR